MKPSKFITALVMGVLFVSTPLLAKEKAHHRVYDDHRGHHDRSSKHGHSNRNTHSNHGRKYSHGQRDRYREKNHHRSIHRGFGYYTGREYRHTRHYRHNSHYYDRHRHGHKRYYRKSHHSDVGGIIVGSLILGAVVNELADRDGIYNQPAQIPVRRTTTTSYRTQEPVEAVEYVEEFLRDKEGRCYSVENRGGRRILRETDSERCI